MRVTRAAAIIALSVGACDATPDSAAIATTSREAANATLDRYFAALSGSASLDSVPLATEVVFASPLTPAPIRGPTAVRDYLRPVVSGVRSVTERRRILDGDDACVVFDLELADGVTLPICDCFRFRAGELVEIRPYFDPTPVSPASER